MIRSALSGLSLNVWSKRLPIQGRNATISTPVGCGRETTSQSIETELLLEEETLD